MDQSGVALGLNKLREVYIEHVPLYIDMYCKSNYDYVYKCKVVKGSRPPIPTTRTHPGDQL